MGSACSRSSSRRRKRAFASAAVHGAGYGITGQFTGVKYLIAEILECLGVALADHLGFRIIVEDPDDAPGIHVVIRSSRGLIIVRNKLADLLKDRFQLFICCAAAALDLSSDLLGILDSYGRVLHLNISITAILVGLSNLHGYSYFYKACFASSA